MDSGRGRTILQKAVSLLRRDTAALMLANLGAALAGIITGVIAARALGAEGRGDLAVITFWPALIATLVDFGIADSLTMQMARRPAEASRHVAVAARLALGAGAVGLVGGALAMPLLLRADQEHLLTDGYLSLVYVPLSALAAVPVGALLGYQRFRAVAMVRIGTALTYAGAMIAAVMLGHGTVRVLMWLTVGARGFPLLLALPFLRDLGSRTTHPPIAGGGRAQAVDGVRLHGARLANVLGAAEDRALASLMLSQVGIGLWQVASALATVMQFVAQAVSQHLYSTTASAGEERSRVVYSAYVRAVLMTSVIVVIGMPLMPLLVPLLYGGEFRPAVPAGVIVMVASIPAAGALTLQAGARAMLRTSVCVASEAAGMLVMALASWPATRLWGGTGLGVAYLAGRATALAVMAWSGGPLHGIPGRQWIPTARRFRDSAWRELRSHLGER